MRAVTLAILFLAFIINHNGKDFNDLSRFDKAVVAWTLLGAYILMVFGL